MVVCVYKRRGLYKSKRIGQVRTSFKEVELIRTDVVGTIQHQPDEVERDPQNEQDGSSPPNLKAESLEALSDPTHTSTPKKEFNSTENIERSPLHLDQSGASPVRRLSTDPTTRKTPEPEVALNASEASESVDGPANQINSSTDPMVRKIQNEVKQHFKDSVEEIVEKFVEKSWEKNAQTIDSIHQVVTDNKHTLNEISKF